MDKIYLTEQKTEDEIDLRELILVLWKKKLFIIFFFFAAAILAGLYSMFIVKPVYHSRLNIIISMPGTYQTKYGDYVLPLTTNEQYINLITGNNILARTIKDMGYENMTIESLHSRISIETPETKTGTVQNSFNIKVAASNPQEAKDLAKILFDNYYEFIDLITVEGAVDYYINKYNVELATLEVSLNSTREILAKNEALLSQIPLTINQKEVMDEIIDSPTVSDYIIFENVINPNYTEIEKDIIENKQTIINLENSMILYNRYLEELNTVKERIEEYKSSGKWDIVNDEFKSIAKTSVYLLSEPIAPSSKTSPNNLRNIIIGAVLGGMIAVVIVITKEYWFISK